MPILSDPSNTRLGSSVREIALAMLASGKAIDCPRLEELTGSDFLVTPETFPITKRYNAQEHLEAGAIMLALKVGGDLVSSVGDRLKGHLVKMLSFECVPCQRGLLSVGYNLKGEDGSTYLGEQSKSACTVFGVAAKVLFKGGYAANYQGLNTSQIRWILSGGVIYPTVPRLDLLEWSLDQLMREVLDTAKDPSRYHFETLTKVPDQPNSDRQSLQILKAVPDGVNILASMPGIGEKRALEYFEFYQGDLMVAIINLCSEDGNHPPQWGEKRAHTLALAWGIEQREKA